MGGAAQAHLYVAARSRADAARMLSAIFGPPVSVMESEMKRYWSSGCWGTAMDGITPERGVWLVMTHRSRPIRLWVPA
jgi:hypothetical protein